MAAVLPRANTQGDKRDIIMAAALELFAERGFHGTAVPLVAEKAGVGAGTIYRYFESKEALVNALYQKWKGEIWTRVYTGFPQAASARAQFSAIWRRLATFVLENPQVYTFLELHHHGSYIDAESRAIENRLHDFAVGVIRKAQGEGILKPLDPELLLTLVHGAFIGVLRACREGRVAVALETFLAAEPSCWDLVRQ
jgi:TetR/AcrR family transcriptional regulator, repressor of fatR-cypB operon